MAAETPETTSHFELDGTTYSVPDFLSLDLNEWELIWDECEVALTDFSEEDDPEREEHRQRRLRNPRLERAFIMVALRRARPDADPEEIRADAGRIKLIPYLTDLAGAEENPTSVSEPAPSSSSSFDSSSESSSPVSAGSSDEPDDALATTGTGG